MTEVIDVSTEDVFPTSPAPTLTDKNQRMICGELVQFKTDVVFDSNGLNYLDPKCVDDEVNGPDGWDEPNPPFAYRPMSEYGFGVMSKVRGFAEYNGKNYAGYLEMWYAKHDGFLPPRSATAEAFKQLQIRKQELEDARKNESISTPEFELAERNVLVARELYHWSCGTKYAASDAKKTGKELESLASVIGDRIGFFDEYRVSGLDYWILPKNLEPYLDTIVKRQFGNGNYYSLAVPSHDHPIEISLDKDDKDDNTDSRNTIPSKVLYSGRVPRNYCILCSRDAGLSVTETILSPSEMSKRKRVEQEEDRDARQKRRNGW
jgi:hypothetical protein